MITLNVCSIQYSGRGLEYGDCGMKINEADKNHAGKWTCVTVIGKDFSKPEISEEIFVSVYTPLLSKYYSFCMIIWSRFSFYKVRKYRVHLQKIVFLCKYILLSNYLNLIIVILVNALILLVQYY